MNNDLISRSELKKAFIEECCGCCDNCSHCMTGYKCELIENAPTVEERPQGEWNYIQAGMCVCPFCGAMPHKLYKGFCANCGAYMKKGGDNE